jgi:hypothetical protein
MAGGWTLGIYTFGIRPQAHPHTIVRKTAGCRDKKGICRESFKGSLKAKSRAHSEGGLITVLTRDFLPPDPGLNSGAL